MTFQDRVLRAIAKLEPHADAKTIHDELDQESGDDPRIDDIYEACRALRFKNLVTVRSAWTKRDRWEITEAGRAALAELSDG